MIDVTTPSPRPRAALRGVVVSSCVFYALVAAWELRAPLPGGHLGNMAGAAIAGENMLRHHVLGAVLEYTPGHPTPAQLYTHHPYGVFVLSALAHALVGHGWVATKLPAVVLSALSPPLLFLLARALYGELAGAIATAAFVVVPINLAYANFHSLEVPLIASGLFFGVATVRFFQTWARRYAVGSVLGALLLCHMDWIGMAVVGAVAAIAFVRAYVVPRRLRGPVDVARHAAWFAWICALSVGSLLFYLIHFARVGHLQDLLGAYAHRSAGAAAPLPEIFGPRRVMWLLWMLPAPALVVLALGSLVGAWRALSHFEHWILPVWTGCACTQYLLFRNGADVHVFWPHMASASVALGAGALARALHDTLARGRWAPHALLATTAPAALFVVTLARVALPIAWQSRLTGGRFDDGGRYIGIDQDRNQIAAYVANELARDRTVGLHASFERTWPAEYAIGRPLSREPDVLLADARRMTADDLTRTAHLRAVTAIGPYLVLARGEPAGWTSLQLEERQPTRFGSLLGPATDLVRRVGERDDFATHEWREHLGLPTEPPIAPPATPEEARVAYNTTHDAALRERALGLVTRRLDVPFSGGVRLVGVGLDDGPAHVVTLLWETSSSFQAADGDFLVRSKITAPPALWPSRIDLFEKELAPPMALRPALWKPGRLYAQRFVAMRRLGEEAVWGVWAMRAGPPRVPEGPQADGARLRLWVWER